MTEDQKKKLKEIAQKLGVTVEELLKSGSPEVIIEAYEKNNFQILNE